MLSSCLSGQRFIKLAKSPLSPPLAFPFNVTSSGISLLNDDGVEMPGPEIHSISWQGLIWDTSFLFVAGDVRDSSIISVLMDHFT